MDNMVISNKDFFVNYNHRDAGWAEWIAWQLEAAGYTTIIQAWDFNAGSNFVLEIDRALKEARRVIAVLSSSYLNSDFTAPEWAGKFVEDPKGEGRKVIPVRVEDILPQGLLSAIAFVDLVGKDEVTAARELLSKVKQERSKPLDAPSFPGNKPSFPGVHDRARGRGASVSKMEFHSVAPASSPNRNQVPLYAKISLVTFFCCLCLLILFIANAQSLSGLGLTEHVYYLVLVLMGLTAAVFLFGVIPSSATFEGKLLGGTLRLGGAVVGAALVVVGGYYFIPRGFTFPLTVYVQGQGGPSDIVLRNSGHVAIQLGPEVQRELVGENGQAYFPAIPSNFRGQEVPVWIESDGYEAADARKKQRLESAALNLIVKEKVKRYKIAGNISDKVGNPIAGVRVALPDYNSAETETNQDGHYELEVTDANQRMVTLVAQKQGYNTARLSPTLGDSGFNFSLQPEP